MRFFFCVFFLLEFRVVSHNMSRNNNETNDTHLEDWGASPDDLQFQEFQINETTQYFDNQNNVNNYDNSNDYRNNDSFQSQYHGNNYRNDRFFF